MKRRHALTVFALTALSLMPAAAISASVLITLESVSPYYQPQVATVLPETPIQWSNPTASPHSIKHDACLTDGFCAFDSGAVRPDGIYTIEGLRPGRYSYHCELHPIMRGVLIVIEPAAEGPSDRRLADSRVRERREPIGPGKVGLIPPLLLTVDDRFVVFSKIVKGDNSSALQDAVDEGSSKRRTHPNG